MTNEAIIAKTLKWCSEREVMHVMPDDHVIRVTLAQLLEMLHQARNDVYVNGAPE